jgi:hypothetical protein
LPKQNCSMVLKEGSEFVSSICFISYTLANGLR